VVAEAGDGAARALGGGVNLAILGIAMPRMTGLRAARELSRRAPDVRLLILSMYDNEQYLFEALKAGASGLRVEVGGRPRTDRGMPAAMRGNRSSTPARSPP